MHIFERLGFAVLNRRRAARAVRWRISNLRYRSGIFRLKKLQGAARPGDIAVIMCLWNRPLRIDSVLDELDGQSSDRTIRLLLWNNRRSDAKYYRDRIRRFNAKQSLSEVSLFTSPRNVGGMGRFFIAHKLWKRGYLGPFIMLDDDEVVSPSFIADLLRSSGVRTVAGWWAWTMSGDYWARTPATAGDRVSYVGTGGSICDISIVSNRRFFTDLPARFSFLEDIWMSGYARHLGWSLAKVETPISFVLDETNQHHDLAEAKAEFYRYLELDDTPAGSG
jgi:hypothetical protein